MSGKLPQDCPCNAPHGPLYDCPGYSAAKLRQIQEDRAQLEKNCRDPGWAQRQIDNGTDPSAVAMLQALMGVTPGGPGIQ